MLGDPVEKLPEGRTAQSTCPLAVDVATATVVVVSIAGGGCVVVGGRNEWGLVAAERHNAPAPATPTSHAG